MRRTSKLYLVVPNSGRSISDASWQTIEPKHSETWRAAVALLKTHEVEVDGVNYSIEADWTPVLRRHERQYRALRYLEENTSEKAEERFKKAKFPQRSSRSEIQVRSVERRAQYNLGAVEGVIHDTFLMMNVAAPGCCDFYKASLVGGNYEPDVSLSNVNFEGALLTQLNDGWPESHFLDLEKVIFWFRKVRSGLSQIPQNPMERALFALLHTAKLDMSPIAVVWLFYAFESLFQTRAGENFSSLVNRMRLLLELDDKGLSVLKKKMRALYDIRNAIVHGGFEVVHPMHADHLDERVDAVFGRLLDAMNFGHALLLASIQRTIQNGWCFPCFDETVRGEKI